MPRTRARSCVGEAVASSIAFDAGANAVFVNVLGGGRVRIDRGAMLDELAAALAAARATRREWTTKAEGARAPPAPSPAPVPTASVIEVNQLGPFGLRRSRAQRRRKRRVYRVGAWPTMGLTLLQKK